MMEACVVISSHIIGVYELKIRLIFSFIREFTDHDDLIIKVAGRIISREQVFERNNIIA